MLPIHLTVQLGYISLGRGEDKSRILCNAYRRQQRYHRQKKHLLQKRKLLSSTDIGKRILYSVHGDFREIYIRKVLIMRVKLYTYLPLQKSFYIFMYCIPQGSYAIIGMNICHLLFFSFMTYFFT